MAERAAAFQLLVGIALVGFGCDRSTEPARSSVMHTVSVRDVTDAQWETLAKRKIFFGHQSVGGNILDGVRAVLADNPHVRLRVVSGDEPARVEGAALVESAIGENGDPRSKALHFRKALDEGLGSQGGIAMYKYCYVDVDGGTDTAQMFDEYRATIESVRSRHPDVTIVHFTLPLTTVESFPKRLVKRALRRTTAVDLNARRNEFNRRVVAQYGGSEPVFDLATLQSTRPNGRRTFVRSGDEIVFTLAPEWTSDGGHLNAAGSRMVAEHLLALLAGLAEEPASKIAVGAGANVSGRR